MTLQLHHLHTDGPKPLYKKIAVDEYNRLRDENDELRMKVATLEEAQRWRKFIEERPSKKQWILVFSPNHSQFTTGVELRRWDVVCKFDVEVQEIYEKWMPLPKAPEEEK